MGAKPRSPGGLAQAELVVPEGEAVVQSLLPTRSRLYVDYLVGGPSELRMFDLAGKPLGTLGAEAVANVGSPVRLAGDAILYGSQGCAKAFTWFAYDPAAPDPRPRATRLTDPPAFTTRGELPGVEVVREFGEEWHLAGNLTKKQNVFDDFIACAQWLVDNGYTTPQRLAIEGGSNGGLLMGAAMVQRPPLFRAVVSHVGIYDMLRVEATPNGAFNVTEFGSVKDEAQFKALYACSPLHHVADGTTYPAVLLTTGEHDGRVEPWMSYKMAARLQAANPGGRPVLLRVASDTGHGMGSSLASVNELHADAFAFLFTQLGMK